MDVGAFSFCEGINKSVKKIVAVLSKRDYNIIGINWFYF